jgi:hypothetical protein
MIMAIIDRDEDISERGADMIGTFKVWQVDQAVGNFDADNTELLYIKFRVLINRSYCRARSYASFRYVGRLDLCGISAAARMSLVSH